VKRKKEKLTIEVKRNTIKIRKGQKMPTRKHQDKKNDYNRRDFNDAGDREE